MPRRISLVVSGCVLSGPQNNPGEFWFYELAGIFVQEGVEMDRSAARKARGIAAATVLPILANGPDASPPAVTPPAATAPAPRVTDVSYQPSAGLESVHAGDAKETVFEPFGTRVERRSGSLVQVEGMRLRASGRSAQHALVEVAEVRITDAVATGSLYWFLFGDGRLIAWGRAKEWPVAAARYQVEIDYQPDRS